MIVLKFLYSFQSQSMTNIFYGIELHHKHSSQPGFFIAIIAIINIFLREYVGVCLCVCK